jgi:hypothetical protein
VAAGISIITSRCGSASLMGLGVAVTGLMAAAVVVAAGELWTTHQSLQDALDNAVWSMQGSSQATRGDLQSLVQVDGGFAWVRVTRFQRRHGVVKASVAAPVGGALWPRWLGIKRPRVTASTL